MSLKIYGASDSGDRDGDRMEGGGVKYFDKIMVFYF